MAEHKIQGGDMLLFIDPTGGTNYDTVVCLTSVSVSDSVQPVDASSACGPDKSPGAVQISISFEGQHLQDPNTGSISGSNLLLLLRAEQTIGWKLSPVTPVGGDEIQEGIGFISELSSTYSYDSIGIFSMTISPFGLPTISIQPITTFTLGQFYNGGYVAYIDNTGQHGLLIKSLDNISRTVVRQYWEDTYHSEATSTAYGTGGNNTDLIIAAQLLFQSSHAELVRTTFGNDWHMPSIDELVALSTNNNLFNFDTIPTTTYSSSSADGTTNYFLLVFSTNTIISLDKIVDVTFTIPIKYF